MQPRRRGTTGRCEMMTRRVRPSITEAVLVLGGLALVAAPAFAERPARFENAILYSNLRSDRPTGSETFHGYKLGYTVFLNRHFGLGGDLVQAEDHNVDLLFGPEISLLDKGRVGVRLHGRVGSIRRLYRGLATGATVHGWHFASTVGSSVDVYLGKGFAWRVVHPEVVWWRRGDNHTDFRVSTGLVLRFGKID